MNAIELYKRYPVGTIVEIDCGMYTGMDGKTSCLATVQSNNKKEEPNADVCVASFYVVPHIPLRHGRYRSYGNHCCSEESIIRVVEPIKRDDLLPEDLFTL